MSEDKKPLQMFFGGLAIIGFLEFLLSGTGKLFVSAYAVGVLTIACSVFYGALNLLGELRYHTPFGVTASVAGLLIGSVVTWHVAARFLSML
jgi:hypothetical protein